MLEYWLLQKIKQNKTTLEGGAAYKKKKKCIHFKNEIVRASV